MLADCGDLTQLAFGLAEKTKWPSEAPNLRWDVFTLGPSGGGGVRV